MMIVYCSVVMTALMAMVSLTVDWGRVETAKTELRNAADAAARYAALGLVDNTYVAKAQLAASQNKVDGSALSLLSTDVDAGYWNPTTHTYTVNGTPKNAVRVNAAKTAARGTAVPLVFASAIGLRTCDVTATSIVHQTSLAVVGLNGVTLSGLGVIRRKSTEGGSVTVESNGSWSMASGTSITGDVYYRSSAPSGTVTGEMTYLPADLAFPTPVTPGGTTNYGAIALTGGSNAVPPGNMAVTSFTVSGNNTLTLYGNTNVYCSGAASFSGTTTLVTNGYTLVIYCTSSSAVTITNASALPVSLYAPLSAITLNGSATFTGAVVGNTVSISGPVEYTGTMPIPTASTGDTLYTQGDGVSTVK